MDKVQPRLNQIVFINLGYSDEWDNLERARPYLIKNWKEEDNFLSLQLLTITSQDKSQAKVGEKQFISQYEIRFLPACLKINPSFIRIQRPVNLKITKSKLTELLCLKCLKGCFKKEEYDFLMKKHEDYRNDKLNALKLRPPIEVEID